MVYLTNDEINNMANKVIQRYRVYIGVEWELFKVEPIKLAEMLGLDVKFVDFGDDSGILGFTGFNEMCITLADANQSDITLELSNRTLVINEALKRGCEGRLNFTIAHEIAHHIIDIVCGANYSIKFRQLPHFEKPGNRFSLDYDEYMANQLAAALLMPDGFVDIVFYKLFEVDRIERIHSILDKILFKKFCAMAALFGVSKPALAIRLQKKGLLGEYIFAGYESLLDIPIQKIRLHKERSERNCMKSL